MIGLILVVLFAAALAWAKMERSRRVYRARWVVAVSVVVLRETVKFYRQYRDEIAALLVNTFENSGEYSMVALFGDKWDANDPLAFEDANQNFLAWPGLVRIRDGGDGNRAA